jgi:hypothetical protein
MADWLDKRLGNFCQDMQKQIEELPLLSAPQKQKFLQMLNECAEKADQSPKDSIGFMREGLLPMQQQIQIQTGKRFRIT